MIEVVEAIHPDQTFTSPVPPNGALCIHYPRGSQNVLSVNTDVSPIVPKSIPIPPAGIGRYEQFWKRSDGNYQTVSDRPGSVPVIIAGYEVNKP